MKETVHVEPQEKNAVALSLSLWCQVFSCFFLRFSLLGCPFLKL